MTRIEEVEHQLKMLSKGPTVDDYPLGTFGSDQFGPFGISGITRIEELDASSTAYTRYLIKVAGRKTFPFYVPSQDADRWQEDCSEEVDAYAISQQQKYLQREVGENLCWQTETLYQALPSELPSALTVTWTETYNHSFEHTPSVEECASSIRERARDLCEVFEEGMLARTKAFQAFVHDLTRHEISPPKEETIEEVREQRDHLAALLLDATARLEDIATSSHSFLATIREVTS